MNTSPDIIFICSDQWNARYLRCAGHPQVQTPHLDALAATGCIFDAAYTPSPVCMPARASLASGETDSVHDAVFSEISRQDQFCYMVRDARWKWSIQAQNERLFDLQNDPHEMQNLAQLPAHTDTAQRLRNRLLTFLTDTQLNHARGYKPLFTRIGMQFPTEDPEDRKRIIRNRLRQVHKHQP